MRRACARARRVGSGARAAAAGKKPVAPADQLWTEGNEAYEDEAYDSAIEKYKALLDQYPFDPNAEEAELKIAQAYYHAERYPEAIAAFGDFERMHPTSHEPADRSSTTAACRTWRRRRTSDRDQQSITNALDLLPERRRPLPRHARGPSAPQLRIRECREALAAPRRRHRRLLPPARQPARRRGAPARPPDRLPGDRRDGRRAVHVRRARTTTRDEPEEADLALATLVAPPPRRPARRRARASSSARDDAGREARIRCPLLVAQLDELRTQAGPRRRSRRPSRRTPIARHAAARVLSGPLRSARI